MDVNFPSEGGRFYVVQCSEDLMHWRMDSGVVRDTGFFAVGQRAGPQLNPRRAGTGLAGWTADERDASAIR